MVITYQSNGGGGFEGISIRYQRPKNRGIRYHFDYKV